MIKRFVGLVSATAALAFANPAAAAVQILSFSGVANSNSKNNANNPFGAANASLSGQAFLVNLSWDVAAFANMGSCGVPANTSCTFTLNGTRTVTQSITIGSVTQMFVLNSGSFTLNAAGNDEFSFSITGSGVFTLNGTNFKAANSDPNGFFPSQSAVNSAAFNNFTALSLATPGAAFTQNTTGFYLQAQGGSIASVTASNVAAVPEPSSWALMVAGLGAVGFSLRRRKVAAAFRFA